MGEGEAMMKELGAVQYYEVSAKLNVGIEDAVAAALEPKNSKKTKVTIVGGMSSADEKEIMVSLR